jgi:NADH:ubiquinone oxidoreductase subunit D
LRLIESYDGYSFYNFLVPVGAFGDSYDRFLVRAHEMVESCSIISQCVNFLQVFANLDD